MPQFPAHFGMEALMPRPPSSGCSSVGGGLEWSCELLGNGGPKTQFPPPGAHRSPSCFPIGPGGDALLEPGSGVLSIYYLGKKFIGDLQPDGRIVWQETGQVFNSPSAWATHCKKLVNPAKKSGCGWASVKYKGQKLDKYKAAWLRRHQLHMPTAAADESPASEAEEEELLMEEEEEEVLAGVSSEDKSRRPLGKGATETAHPEAPPPGKRAESKIRVPVRYCMLGSRDSARSPHTLVEVTSFAAINKFQPFNVAVSSNVLFLLDFHSHLTRSEVVGYLGGRWDINSQMLTVLRAFPCRSRLGDADIAAAIEEEIYQSLFLRGLSLVGWYHSHPHSPALPSLQDIDAQMDYQLRLQGASNGFQPCLALLCSPYYAGNPGPESKIAPFWVMPPPEQRPSDYGIPMDVDMACVQDSFLTNDILHEMIYQSLFLRGLSLVGWYHSHPSPAALPSLQDIDAQMDYQLRLQGASNGFQPCLALLCSPYYAGNPGPESKIAPFWVMPPPEQRPSDYGIPMDVDMACVQDSFLTNDILHEMMLLVDFYKGAPDLVRFQEAWSLEHSYLDKLKISLASRTPKDQGLGHVLEQVCSVLKQAG
ncbi:MPN domain-containing protein [Heterocephalus glaber]|uniref:MPN domain-containing protein n=1 Tax=Heterocephalus glaber TaxID=10181 RepID=G5BZA4_HETGA|nr:MPN domain-containing protein [Heterocephalus glaber]